MSNRIYKDAKVSRLHGHIYGQYIKVINKRMYCKALDKGISIQHAELVFAFARIKIQ